jgi:hypothetical protein
MELARSRQVAAGGTQAVHSRHGPFGTKEIPNGQWASSPDRAADQPRWDVACSDG